MSSLDWAARNETRWLHVPCQDEQHTVLLHTRYGLLFSDHNASEEALCAEGALLQKDLGPCHALAMWWRRKMHWNSARFIYTAPGIVEGRMILASPLLRELVHVSLFTTHQGATLLSRFAHLGDKTPDIKWSKSYSPQRIRA